MKKLFRAILVIGFISVSVFAQPELDTTFNSTGKAVIGLLEESGAWNIAVQPDNKIIMVSGCYRSGYAQFCTVRLNADGSVDTTFGTDPPPGFPSSGPRGSVVTRFDTPADWEGQATGVALQSDGKIIVTGSTSHWHTNEAAMVRYNGDGTLDTTFGSGGTVLTHLTGASNRFEVVRAVALQPDGKIVVTGDSMRITQQPLDNIYTHFLARFLPNGTLDATFGQNGVVNIIQPNGESSSGQSIAIQPDGKILIGGNHWHGAFVGNRYQNYFLARYNPDGTYDTSWNGTGSIKISYGNSEGDGLDPTDGISSVAIQPDGRVVAIGFSTSRLFRFESNGSPDISFDTDGVRSVFLANEMPYDFVISSDGRITVVGMSRLGLSVVTDFPYLAERFLPDGSPDPTFGDNGYRKFYLAPGFTIDGARAAAIDSLGRVVIAGIAGDATQSFPWEHSVFRPFV